VALTYIFLLIGSNWKILGPRKYTHVSGNQSSNLLFGRVYVNWKDGMNIGLGLIGDSSPQKQSARTLGGELGLQSSLGRDSVRWQTLATHWAMNISWTYEARPYKLGKPCSISQSTFTILWGCSQFDSPSQSWRRCIQPSTNMKLKPPTFMNFSTRILDLHVEPLIVHWLVH